MNTSFKTAEYVSPQHPDKLCDRVADALLDAHLTKDSYARTAIEVTGGHGALYIVGEVRSRATVDIDAVARRIVGQDIKIVHNIVTQSPEIARGVDVGGAGDQGVMIGYATDETPELLPLELVLSRDLNRYLYSLWPHDGKTQVTLSDGEIAAIVASFQHARTEDLKTAVQDWARRQQYVNACCVKYRNSNPELHINPAGDWRIGGFDADTGLTGRKLIVDNYGPSIPIGGGAYSGKDPSKVDRSAAYMARKIAVDYVRRFQAHEVFVRLAYAIGYDQPVEMTAIVDGEPRQIEDYDLTPGGIIEQLVLTRPIYEDLAT
ncbi:hypothetical protein B7Z17_02270, partial [Candidatus Saccharibacteria bacterium 32-49-10]